MVTIVVAVAYFAAVYLGPRTRLRLLTQHILRSAKRIYSRSTPVGKPSA